MDRVLDLFLNFYGPMPYILILLILLVCGMGVPIPEDITLCAAGILSYYGVASVSMMLGVCFAGILVGDLIMYGLGRKYGRKLTKIWFFHKFLPDDRLDQVKVKFHRWGNKLIFAARFMPGFRAPVFFSAGVLHLPVRIFVFYDGMAALISVPAIVLTVYYLGDQVDIVIKRIQRVEYGIISVIIFFVLFLGAKWYWSKKRATRTS